VPAPAARDPEKIKGILSLVFGVVLLALAIAGFVAGKWALAIVALVLACVDLSVAYLYFKRRRHLT
jgi:uncharacterized membrane protein HdeD (DUF308 family)